MIFYRVLVSRLINYSTKPTETPSTKNHGRHEKFQHGIPDTLPTNKGIMGLSNIPKRT